MTAATVFVTPASALDDRRRLFDALSEALGVEFSADEAGAVARIVFDIEPDASNVPTLVFGDGDGRPVEEAVVSLTRASELDVCLRGWRIPDGRLAGTRGLVPNAGAIVLAVAGSTPVWTTEGRHGSAVQRSAVAPVDLEPSETLLDRLTPGAFFDLLPLVHFLRLEAACSPWQLPAVRASFLMDDPNLHSSRYGYLDFAALATQASRAGEHFTIATIPLDGWFASRSARRLFIEHPEALSLMVHGNNHTRHELADGRSDQSRLELVAQSLRRSRAFEARSGIPVSPVMAAPHGRCSEETATDMARLGFESLCNSRTFPWLDRPPEGAALAGWHPADTSSVTPIVPRIFFTQPPEILPLRAFLRQPIILAGHHWDLAENPDLFTEWAGHVQRLGNIEWASVGSISRSLVSLRMDGPSQARVRPHTRVVRVDLPREVDEVVIDAPSVDGYELVEVTNAHGTTVAEREESRWIDVSGDTSITVRLRSADALDPTSVPSPQWSMWPIARRFATEARDRTKPLVDRLKGT